MNFDRLAPHYGWMEFMLAGGLLQRVRTVWLDELRDRRRILSVGEGHGRFVEACLQRFPRAEITCVEASDRMLARARRRAGTGASRVRWEHADVCAWSTSDRFDAIVTCFFLDCFPPPMLFRIVEKLARCAVPGTLWLIADFAIPAAGPARWRAQVVHALMYWFFRATTALPARRFASPDTFLAQHGFTLVGRRTFDWGLLRADLWRRT